MRTSLIALMALASTTSTAGTNSIVNRKCETSKMDVSACYIWTIDKLSTKDFDWYDVETTQRRDLSDDPSGPPAHGPSMGRQKWKIGCESSNKFVRNLNGISNGDVLKIGDTPKLGETFLYNMWYSVCRHEDQKFK